MFELAAFVFGFTEALKMAGAPSKILPILAIFIGGLANMVYLGFTPLNGLLGMLVGMTVTAGVNRASDLAKKIGGQEAHGQGSNS